MADLRMLANEENVEVIEFGIKKKYHLASLKPEDFADRPELKNKFFWNKIRSLDRFHIPEISKAEYEAVAKTFKQTAKFNAENLKYETASPYYIRKARVALVAKELGCTPYDIDLTDYIWDERYYLRYDFMENIRYADEMYRDDPDKPDDRELSAYEVYITQDPKQASVDEELWDELYYFCTKAIQARKAMLLSKVDKCLGFLITVLDYTNGFAENMTVFQAATLQGYKKFFTELLENEEFYDFLTKHNDVSIFATDDKCHSDYVDTYRSLCKLLIRGTDEDMAYFESMLKVVDDPYVDEILEIRESIEFRDIYDDSDSEDEDDILDDN